MKRYLTVFLCLLASLPVLAQGYQPAQVPRKAQELYNEALNYIVLPDPASKAKTVALLEKAIGDDAGYLDAYVQLGSLYANDRQYGRALPYFDKANELDSVYFLPGYLRYAKAAAGTGNFDRALFLIERFLQQPGLRDESRQNALRWKAHFLFGQQGAVEHHAFQPQNLGDGVNSKDPEYFPSLTIDQQTLIFTRNLQSRNEDFFITHRQPDSTWGKAEGLGPPINSMYNEGAQTISQDGRWLLYTICNHPGGMGSCDIYYATKTDSGWSAPGNMGPGVNSPAWDTQPCLSPDNRDLYFVSNRPGGKGGSDLYVSHLQSDGTWGRPVNLGDSINTPGDESSPFIHADNQTLYFASTGWPGVGGTDLYFAQKNVDGHWGSPHNLGYPINTIDHEGSLFVAADGQTAYFASDRSDSRGLLDLYTFTLYPAARPVKTLYVHGYVYDQKTNRHLTAVLDLTDLATGDVLTHIPTDPDGSYLVTLPVGKNYAFSVSKPGYLFYSDHFTLSDTVRWKPYEMTIGLQPLEVNARVTLKNIFFGFNQHDLQPESQIELDRVTALLQQNPTLKIRIDGHTDSVGTAAYNMTLSSQRAKAVVDYLVSKGIASERLSAKGYGNTRPVGDNNTEAGRALNRRTEMVVTSR